jgi:hypothetical protein
MIVVANWKSLGISVTTLIRKHSYVGPISQVTFHLDSTPRDSSRAAASIFSYLWLGYAEVYASRIMP